MPKLFIFMSKVANRSKKIVDKNNNKSENADLLLLLFNTQRYNSKSKKLINHELMVNAEDQKSAVINNYIKGSRANNNYIYLASSHNDCAKDHLKWQGKLYYDDKAPEEIVKWAQNHGHKSIQWVMGEPVWFITRPNCRHFFKSLPLDVVKKYSLPELKRRYKTHRKTGDANLKTPQKVTLEEYEDRLKMLEAMYAKHKTEKLRREIEKTKLLIRKWRKLL